MTDQTNDQTRVAELLQNIESASLALFDLFCRRVAVKAGPQPLEDFLAGYFAGRVGLLFQTALDPDRTLRHELYAQAEGGEPVLLTSVTVPPGANPIWH